MIKGLFYIFLFYFLGELLSSLTGGFMPGSLLGMILLFLSLFFKLIHPSAVKDAATVITKNMAVFFVPVTVGLMTYAGLLSNYLLAIVSAIGVSTLLVIITVALIQERFEKNKKKGATHE
jgi:holin-like protein